jgi:hypothetical protein
VPRDDYSLIVVRGLAIECGLKRISNGYDEVSFSYRDPNNKLWFVVAPEADVLIQLHEILLIYQNNTFVNRPIFRDMYSISLYEPTSIAKLRKIFWKLRFGLL